MSSIKKYQLPIYDPPAVYADFNGGINTSLSNETLQANELRDGLNCHYSNSALINRPGASLLKRLHIPLETGKSQGDFIYSTDDNSWMISVRNGHIFYGAYGTDTDIYMEMLPIRIKRTERFDDPENYIANLKTYDTIDYTVEHEGFIYKYYKYSGEGGSEDEPVIIDDTSEEGSDVTDDDDYEETLIIQNTKPVQGIPVDDYFLMATGTRILKIKEGKNDEGTTILFGEILDAKKTTAWDYNKIGPNNLSPFPNYYVEGVNNTPMTEIGQILTNPNELALDQTDWEFKAIIACQSGYDISDFYYTWEVKIEGITDWKKLLWWNASKNTDNASSKGVHTLNTTREKVEEALGQALEAGQKILIRCGLTSKFAQNLILDDKTYQKEVDEFGEFVSEQASAIYSRTHITKTILETYEPVPEDVDQYFYNIHSCTKVIADGQKAIFYDDAYGTCEWFKTVINQYNYITYNGGLSFKTTKNERLTGVVVFDTNIVVFADNPQLGGNISVVTGNGDDYNADDYYSPYKRSIVNTNVSCDAYNTIQVADNYIIFKYRKDIYMLDTNGLSNSDTVKVQTINDMVKQKLNSIEFPLDRIREPKNDEHLEYDFHELNQCLKPDEIFSEVTDGYYGLIFPNQGFFEDTLTVPNMIDKMYEGSNPAYVNRLIENVHLKPGLRWKCYFRDGKLYQNKTKEQYPWLRDVGYLFDIVSVLYIEGVPCFIRKNGDLIKFDRQDGTNYTNDNYKLRFRSKAYNMENAALCKFLDNVCLYYNRDFDDIAYTTLWIHNEAGYEIYGPENEAFITLRQGQLDQVRYGERIKFDDALTLMEKDKPIEQYEDYSYIDPQDKPVEILNDYKGIVGNNGNWISPVLNRPSFTSKTYTPRWRFPFLSAQVTFEIKINQAFSLSALNFSYTTSDMPDFTREKLYREIMR